MKREGKKETVGIILKRREIERREMNYFLVEGKKNSRNGFNYLLIIYDAKML